MPVTIQDIRSQVLAAAHEGDPDALLHEKDPRVNMDADEFKRRFYRGSEIRVFFIETALAGGDPGIGGQGDQNVDMVCRYMRSLKDGVDVEMSDRAALMVSHFRTIDTVISAVTAGIETQSLQGRATVLVATFSITFFALQAINQG